MRLNKVLLASFSTYKKGKRTLSGNIPPLLSYFVTKSKTVVLIDQPHPLSDDVVPIVEVYEKGELIKKDKLLSIFYTPLYWLCRLHNTSDETKFSFKIRDFLSVLQIGFQSREKIDLFIGLESINALAGILLKKMGKIKKVVYYVSDYSPQRYSNPIFNKVYLWLDRICAYYADFIWDVSPAMHSARIKAGLNRKKSAPVIRVGNAVPAQDKIFLPISRLKKQTLVYMGTLDIDNGSDLAIEALPLVLKKFPRVFLHIIGGGNPAFFKRLKGLARALKVRSKIKFHGFILKEKDMLKRMSVFYLALAPYRDIPNSFRFYGDSTKIRAYLSVGLPVITTSVPPMGKEIKKAGAGMIVEDNPQALAKGIIRLLGRKNLYRKYRQAAIAFARENTWENSFGQALAKMGFGVKKK